MKIQLPVRMTFVLTILVLFGTLKVMGATLYSVANGNWNSTSTWSATSGGSSGASVPVAGDDVYLEAGYSVMVTADAACVSITFTGSGTTLTVNSTVVLTVSGAVTAISSTTTTYSSLLTGAGTLNCASLAVGTNIKPSQNITTTLTSSIAVFSISGDLSLYCSDIGNRQNDAVFNLSSGTVSVNGTSSFQEDTNQNISTITMATGSQNGTLILKGATPFNLGNGTNSIILSGTATTVIYNYSGNQTVYPVAYQNLTLTGSGTKTTTGVTVNGILSMEGTAMVSTAPIYGSAATLQYNTATARTAGAEWISPFAATGGVIIDNTGTITLNAAKVFGANTNVPLFIKTGATLNTSASNFGLTFHGDFIRAGTLTAGSSPVTIAGTTSTQNIAGFTTTGTIAITKTSGTATFTGAVTCSLMTITTGGTLSLGTGLTHNATTLSLGGYGQSFGSWGGTGSAATYINTTYFAAATGILNVASSIFAAGTWIGSTSTDWHTPTNWWDGTVPIASTNVVIPAGGNQPVIGAAAVCNSITVNTGATLTITGTNTLLTVSGNWSNSGTFTANSGTVIFNGAAQTVGPGPYNNLTLAGTGIKTTTGVTVNGILSMEGTATVSAAPSYGVAAILQYNKPAAFTSGVEWITPFTGSGGIIIANTGTISLNAAKEIIGPLRINTGSTLATVNNNLTLGGDLTCNGTFTTGTSTVTFNGSASQTLSGTTALTYNTVIISNTSAAITANTNFSVTGTLTVNSTAILSPAPAVIISGAGTLTGNGTVQVTRIAATPDFNTQYTITTKTLTNLTVDYTGAGAQTVNAINYGSLTVSSNGSRTVTLANTGTIGVAGIFTTSETNTSYVVTGSTVNFNGNGAQTINAFNYNNLTISNAGIKQLGGAVTANSNITISSGTTLDVTAFNFSLSVGGNWINNGGTFNFGSGTVTFNGTAAQAIQGTATSQSFYNLIINKTTGTIITLPTGSTTTITANDLTVNQGTLQINDATNIKRTINVNGNLMVQSAGSITTGTGNTIGSYTLPTNFPSGQYFSIFHEMNVTGNFTNNGSVRFTNLSAPNYGAFATTGAVTVRFIGYSDNTVTLNGLTDFYNLIVDKGSDKTYLLTLSSTSSANFSLYGPALLGRNELSPFTPDNPEVRKALWIKNGTLKLTGNIFIPTLSEGDNANGNGDYAIGGNAQLWIAGSSVTVYTTATASSGFPEAPAGASGVLAGSSYQALSVYGTFRISDGFFGTRNSAGFIFWDTPNSTAEVIFEGGTVNTSVFREGQAPGRASYVQTGGTVIVRGNETEPGEMSGYPVFGIMNPSSSFVMSGGNLIIQDSDSGTPAGGNGFNVSVAPGNFMVTGGTITFETNPANTPSIDISSTANFWNLEIKRLSTASSGTSIANLLNSLIVSNNLTIYANATLSSGTGNFPVTVSRNFTINSGGTYTPGTNTTTFNGGGNYYLWNDGTITNGLYNLTANKTAGTLIMAGTTNDFTVLNDLTIASDTLADGGKNIYVNGNIINNGTHKGAGKISLNKTNGSQSISGNGNGKFRNLELNNTNGATGSAQVSLASNITVTGNLILLNDRIFDISTYLLTIDKLGDITGNPGSSRFIRTSGAVSNGGIIKIFNDTITFTYPVGSGTNYTPATVHINKVPGTYGSVTIKPVNSRHPLVIDPTCFNYYWKVVESGFTGIVPGSVKMTFNYGNLPDDITYVPGKYFPPGWTYTNDVTLVNETTKLISFLSANSFAGDYTAGIPAAFGASVTYYSRASGDWNTTSTWSTVGFGGAEAITIPSPNSQVYIGDGSVYNHTITVTAGNAVSGSLSIKQGSILDLGSSSGNNFGTVVSGSNGTLSISSNSATAIFPAGDFGSFLGLTGGTVNYYSTGIQDFVLPVTTAVPTSMSITNYYNLQITPATGRQITMPNANLVVFGDLTVLGASATGLVGLNSAATRNLTIKNNLNVASGNLLFQNVTAQAVTVEKNLLVSSDAIFNISSLGTGVTNSLSIGGNLTNNGTFDMSVGSNRVSAVTFTGNSDAILSGKGATTDLYSINVNKGNSMLPVLDITSSAFTFSDNTAPLALTNGTFRLTSPVSATISTLGFSIPASACLSANGGTLLIATAADDLADIDLAGKLELKAGIITIGTSTNVINNDIVYAGTGTPTIDIQGGSLFVNGQIRRILTNGLGSLTYKQTGTSTVTINGRNSQPTRAKLEVLNSGSIFEMSSTSTLTIVRGAGTSFNDLYLVPSSSNVTGGTVIFGNGSTEIANQNFTMNVAVPLKNLTIDGTTTSKSVSLSGSGLTVLGNLDINATSVFNCNGLNLTVGGNFTNSNLDASIGLSVGGFRPSTLTQVTTFNSSTANQLITGSTANLTNFAKLVVNNTNTSGTVTLASNTALRVNSDLTLTQGTLADGNNVITVLGNISNSATHTGNGGITLGGSVIQIISGNGSGKFSNLRLNSGYNVQMTASQEITGILTFNTKMLDIGSNLLKLTNTSAGAIAESSATSYIRLNGLVTDLGVQKSYPATPLDYTFPIGISGKYTPARINITANTAIGTITIVPVNSKHPGTTNPLDKQLNYYWNVKKTGFDGLTATHVYTYVAGDVSGNENFYDAARFYLSVWDYGVATSVSVPLHTANFTAVNYVDGDFTAGESTEFGAILTYYSRNATWGGNWDNLNTWSTDSHAGLAASSIPSGQPVIIASGHTVATNGSYRNAYSVALGGTLDLAGTTGHDFGIVTGTGKIKLAPSVSGNFVFPAGDFTTFTSTSGGTIELNNSTGTTFFPTLTIYNNLILSGNGTKRMNDANITLNGNLTNGSGSTFLASTVNKLILSGNWINDGTFTPNDGNIEFNGNTTILGSSNTTFKNMTILSGKVLTGKLSSGFDVAGNWINNGTFNPNSGTVNFSGSTTISGSSVTTFNNLTISSLSTLTGKYNDNVIVQGNWVNNGNYIKNGGTVTFDGTTFISGSSVTTFENLVINGSRSLTLPSSGTVNIARNYTNNGMFYANDGKLVFNGSTQTIGGTAHTQFDNLEIASGSNTSINTSGQTISGTILCNGTLITNANLTLLSSSARTALIVGSGTGDITGNVTMQRYLPSGFGYKYFSSPFQDATVGQFSGLINLSVPFPRFYRYDENRLSAGWINYTNTTGRLEPMFGYAANFGSATAAVTVSLTGVVNNKTLSPLTLINNNKPYTSGFNLIGNPYPSPIDWDATSGWTKTNIDNAIYFFDAGNTDQYTGTYSSYINGVSSDGIASNIIPAMQGFFVHVSTVHPVDATLIFNNGIRINDLNPVFKSAEIDNSPLLRLSAGFGDEAMPSDPVLIYFDDTATQSFDPNMDALKLMNTDINVPSLYVLSPDSRQLSISGMPFPVDSITRIPLGIKTAMDGWITFNMRDLKQMPSELHIYFLDGVTHTIQDLKLNPQYRAFVKMGINENRFALVFSQSELKSQPVVVESEKFTVTRSGGILMVNLNLSDNETGILQVINMQGQILLQKEAYRYESIALSSRFSSGMYVISLISGNKRYSKKIIIPNQ